MKTKLAKYWRTLAIAKSSSNVAINELKAFKDHLPENQGQGMDPVTSWYVNHHYCNLCFCSEEKTQSDRWQTTARTRTKSAVQHKASKNPQKQKYILFHFFNNEGLGLLFVYLRWFIRRAGTEELEQRSVEMSCRTFIQTSATGKEPVSWSPGNQREYPVTGTGYCKLVQMFVHSSSSSSISASASWCPNGIAVLFSQEHLEQCEEEGYGAERRNNPPPWVW